MKIVYTGSFDPMTVGHLDIIKRASQIGEVHVLIAIHPDKPGLIPIDQRVELVKMCCQEAQINAQVDVTRGASVDYVRSLGEALVVRGVRDSTDWNYEANLCEMNKTIAPEVETIFLKSSPKLSHVSSSFARELHRLNQSLRGVCPGPIISFLEEH